VFIGAQPSTEWLGVQLAADDHGFLLTGSNIPAAQLDDADRVPLFLETSRPGIFAVGDVRSGSVKRAATAIGKARWRCGSCTNASRQREPLPLIRRARHRHIRKAKERTMAVSAMTADGRARLLADGNQMPMLGLGVWQVPDGPECVKAVRMALDLGYRHLDTAQAYGTRRASDGPCATAACRATRCLSHEVLPGQQGPGS